MHKKCLISGSHSFDTKSIEEHVQMEETHMNLWWRILFIAAFLSMAGCKSNLLEPLSDDSSREAQIEEARMALNDGDYQTAINILEPGYDPSSADPETSGILASAYMGKAGIDLTNLLEHADDTGSSSFDVIASVLSLHVVNAATSGAEGESASSTARYIDQASINDFIASLEEAQGYLAALVGARGDDDDVVQLGMASVVHFILEIGLQAAGAAGVDNIPVNKEAYREVFPDEAGTAALLTGFTTSIDSTDGVIPSLIDDITRVQDAVVVLDRRIGTDEDIAVKFNGFLSDLLGANEPADLTGTMIETYLSDHLLGY